MWNSYARTGTIALLVSLVCVGAGCTEQSADATKAKVGAALDATKSGADRAIDATKAAGDTTADAAQKTADKTKDAVVATGNAVTDTWITGKLKIKFGDETLLKGSDITIKTAAHVVTLRGTVGSNAAKVRAGEMALGTEGVVDLVNQLIVK